MAGRRCLAMHRAVKAVKEGMSPRVAADTYGVSEGQLRRARKADGLPMMPVGCPLWKRKPDSNKQ